MIIGYFQSWCFKLLGDLCSYYWPSARRCFYKPKGSSRSNIRFCLVTHFRSGFSAAAAIMLQKLAEIDKNALIGICEISRKFIKICGDGDLKVQKQETCPGSAEIGGPNWHLGPPITPGQLLTLPLHKLERKGAICPYYLRSSSWSSNPKSFWCRSNIKPRSTMPLSYRISLVANFCCVEEIAGI